MAQGDQVWWYWCAGGEPPGLYLDYPAIDPRVTFWLCRSYKLEGFPYYAINYRGISRRGPQERRWPEVPWDPRPAFDPKANIHGSGVLVYPGRRYGKLQSSIRSENIRDCREDYGCLWLLRQRAEAAANQAPDSPLVAEARELLKLEAIADSLPNYTRVPQLLLGRRGRVARLIERLIEPSP